MPSQMINVRQGVAQGRPCSDHPCGWRWLRSPLLVVLALFAAGGALSQPAAGGQPAEQLPYEGAIKADIAALAIAESDRKLLLDAYGKRNYTAIWVDGTSPTPAAHALVKLLGEAGEEGGHGRRCAGTCAEERHAWRRVARRDGLHGRVGMPRHDRRQRISKNESSVFAQAEISRNRSFQKIEHSGKGSGTGINRRVGRAGFHTYSKLWMDTSLFNSDSSSGSSFSSLADSHPLTPGKISLTYFI